MGALTKSSDTSEAPESPESDVGARVLVIGIDLSNDPDFAILKASRPEAEFVDLPSRSCEEGRSQNGLRRIIHLARRGQYREVVAAQNYSRLLFLVSFIPAEKHSVFKHQTFHGMSQVEMAARGVARLGLHTVRRVSGRTYHRYQRLLGPRLPGPVGRGNGYGFIERKVRATTATEAALAVSVIVAERDDPEAVIQIIKTLEQSDYPVRQLEVLILDDGRLPNVTRLKQLSTPLSLRVLRTNTSDPAQSTNAAIAQAVGEVLVFLGPGTKPTRSTISAHVRWFSVSAEPMVVMSPPRAPVAADQVALSDDAEPYRRAHFADTSLRKTLALSAGAFPVGLAEPERTLRFAYQLYLKGAFFVEERRLGPSDVGDVIGSQAPLPGPRVSVYIPAYNAATTLRRAIDSALAQTYGDLEVCVCDDGSKDDTVEVLKGYADEPRVRWVRQDNAGIAASSTQAVYLCRGEFIVQLDADDELYPEAVEELIRVIEADHKLSLVYGGTHRIDPKMLIYDSGESFWIPRPYGQMRFIHSCIVSHPRMFRARDFHRTSGFDPRLKNAVDYDFYLKLSERGDVAAIPKPLYRYYIHGSNTSFKDRRTQFRNHVIVVQSALMRRNLDWIIRMPDPEQPRNLRVKLPRWRMSNLAANLLDMFGLPDQADELLERSLANDQAGTP